MKKRLWVLTVLLVLLFSVSCSGPGVPAAKEKYQQIYLDLFDTVTTVTGYAGSEAEFKETTDKIYNELLIYHCLSDIYNDYEDLPNLKTVNDGAGMAPVQVDPRLIELLQFCKEAYEVTDHRVNAAMGSVLKIWHECREEAQKVPEKAGPPEEETLSSAALHVDFDRVIIDETAGTVFIADPEMSLDAGAMAKGYAGQKVIEMLPEGYLLSLGGNVIASGPKADGTPWVVGIRDPDGDSYLHTVELEKGSVVTSGDYQRFFMADGVKYHHIIDPATNYPSDLYKSVTIVCEDSGTADMLSTALFLMPLDEGEKLAKRYRAEVLWIDREGNEYKTNGLAVD